MKACSNVAIPTLLLFGNVAIAMMGHDDVVWVNEYKYLCDCGLDLVIGVKSVGSRLGRLLVVWRL